jgi:hypothetical protein
VDALSMSTNTSATATTQTAAGTSSAWR